MSKEKLPNITLSECIRQLELINDQLFSLKQGTQHLIEAVESGNIEHAKKVIDIFKMKDRLDALNPKD